MHHQSSQPLRCAALERHLPKTRRLTATNQPPNNKEKADQKLKRCSKTLRNWLKLKEEIITTAMDDPQDDHNREDLQVARKTKRGNGNRKGKGRKQGKKPKK